MIERRLVEIAIKASENAYYPHQNDSKHVTKVGAAVLTESNVIFPGCNVTSVISGLGTCAERCAIYSAVASGHCVFKVIAVFFPSKKFFHPCGACLQVIAEFSQVSGKDVKIIEVNSQGKTRTTSIRKLLPGAMGPIDSQRDVSEYRKRL